MYDNPLFDYWLAQFKMAQAQQNISLDKKDFAKVDAFAEQCVQYRGNALKYANTPEKKAQIRDVEKSIYL